MRTKRLFDGNSNPSLEVTKIREYLDKILEKYYKKYNNYNIRDLESIAIHTVAFQATLVNLSRKAKCFDNKFNKKK